MIKRRRFYLTQKGVRGLNIELEGLVSRRALIAIHLKAAREHGDLAENAEYICARQEQEKVEGRIVEIESILRNARAITKPKKADRVRLGSTIRLKNNGANKKFQIVGTVEADPLNGKISDESPIGRVLLGKRVGDEVEMKVHGGTTIYRVVYIS